MKKAFNYLILLIVLIIPSRSQDSTTASQSATVKAALYTMTGIIVPIAVAGTALSFFPPSFGVLAKNGVNYAAITFESGIGFGERKETGVFSNYRLTVGYTHIYRANVRDIFRLEGKKDFHFNFVDRRKIFLEGFDVGGGVLSDFPNYGYTVTAGAWLQSPWISFFGLFPSHTYGITYRYNSYFSGPSFQEISLGVASSLTL